jgi:hypothetical protein
MGMTRPFLQVEARLRAENGLMALMLGNLYTALRSANVEDEVARKAAEEVAGYETALAGVRSDMAPLKAELKAELADVKSDVKLLKWMMGATFALVLALFVKSFYP